MTGYYVMKLAIPAAVDEAELVHQLVEASEPCIAYGKRAGCRTATMTWTFVDGHDSAWYSYHALTRAYAVCVAARIRCEFATVIDGSIHTKAISPRRFPT
jgi:hypothetical protein